MLIKNYQYISLLEPCDVLFTFKKGNWFSKLIWWFSKFRNKEIKNEPQISHTAMYLRDGLIIESTFEGVNIKNIKHFNYNFYDVYIGRCLDTFDKELMIKDAYENAGMISYSFKQLFALMFKKIFQLAHIRDVDEKGMHCSEFIASMFKKQDIIFATDLEPHETSPLDIYDSNKLVKYQIKYNLTNKELYTILKD